MPIISSVPALNAIEKGVGATFTLDKAQLALVASVVASAYYSDQSNWKSVILNYKSSTLSQTTSIGFDASLASPTGIFNVATQATDIFEIQTISIVDFQNGYFVIPRSQLTVVDFDVDMTSPLPTAITWGTGQESNGGTYTTLLNSIERTDVSAYGAIDNVSNEQILSGDGYIEFTLNGVSNPELSDHSWVGLAHGPRGVGGSPTAIQFNIQCGSYTTVPNSLITGTAGNIYQVFNNPFADGTVIKIAIESGDVKFYINNVLVGTQTAPILSYPYRFECSLGGLSLPSISGQEVIDVKLVDL